MDVYSRLMDVDEVIEYLNTKTDRVFDTEKAIKLLAEKNIQVVFEYEGWGTYDFEHEGQYQSCSVKVNGYLSFRNKGDAVQIFRGFLNEINLQEAVVHHLDSHYIRGKAPDNIKIKQGDYILFKNGGRSSLFSHSNTKNFIKIDSNKVGVLKKDLEEFLNKVQIEAMNDKSKIKELESEIRNLINEKAILLEDTAQAKAKLVNRSSDVNSKLATEHIDKEASSRSKDRKLIAMMAILLAYNSKIYRIGDRPNATQINEAIFNLAQQHLGVIDDDLFGLKSNTSKISSAINEYSHIIKNKLKK